jgi:perosamine synthetase
MIPVYAPALSENERESLIAAFDSGWISGAGPEVGRSEDLLGELLGLEVALVSNGTTALHLALQAVGIRPGDKVLVPSFAYVAPANAVKYCGAFPVFVDCDEQTWQSMKSDFESRYDPSVKAIIVVHNYGGIANISEICNWAKSKGLLVIEDCAEALGSKFSGNHVGSTGDIATFSFYGNKTITCGEGGAVACSNRGIMTRIKKLRSQGLAEHRQYWHDVVGYNYRLNNLSASLLPTQLKRLDDILEAKRAIYRLYRGRLANVFDMQRFRDEECPWMVSILLNDETEREKARAFLYRNQVETRPTFYPIHTMPPYFDEYVPLPKAEELALRGVNLPSGPGSSHTQIEHVCELLLEGKSCEWE